MLRKKVFALSFAALMLAGVRLVAQEPAPSSKKNEFMRYKVWRNDATLALRKMTPRLKASCEKCKKKGRYHVNQSARLLQRSVL